MTVIIYQDITGVPAELPAPLIDVEEALYPAALEGVESA